MYAPAAAALSLSFVPKQQIHQHNPGEAEGCYGVLVKHLEEREEAEKENPVETEKPGEGEFLLSIRKNGADDEEGTAKVGVIGD